MGELSPWHLLILAAVFVVLFGSRKLPDAARSLGKSMRIFKAETKALRDDDDDATRQAQAQQQTVQQQPAQPMAAQPVAPPQPLSPPADDGTLVSGVPLAEAQRNQQST
jgi:sec-independent protein translocase protein TatA